MALVNAELWTTLENLKTHGFTIETHGNNRFTIHSPNGEHQITFDGNGEPSHVVRKLAQQMRDEFSWTDTTIRDDDTLETRFKKLQAARHLERIADPNWDPTCVERAERQADDQLKRNRITITFEKITPWDAFQLIDAHEKARIARGLSEDAELDLRAVLDGLPFLRQRKVSKAHKANLGQILRLGHFMLTHQGIAIADDGYLLDGQHRIKAILEEGLSAALPIARGVPNEVFPVIDTGKRRSPAEILGMSGVPDANRVQSVIRILYWYDNEPDWKKWFSRTLSELEIHDLFFHEYVTVGESLNLAKRSTRNGSLDVNIAVLAAVTHIVLRADPTAPIEQFWTAASGSGPTDPLWYELYGPTDVHLCPAFALKRWAAAWSKRPGKTNNRGQRHTEHLICCLRAYGEAVQGNRQKSVIFKETFTVPQPYVAAARPKTSTS